MEIEVEIRDMRKEIVDLRNAVMALQQFLEDSSLSTEESAIIKESAEEYKNGETTSLEQMKKECSE